MKLYRTEMMLLSASTSIFSFSKSQWSILGGKKEKERGRERKAGRPVGREGRTEGEREGERQSGQ